MGDEIYNPTSKGTALIGNYLPYGTRYTAEDFQKVILLAQDKSKYIENVDGDGLPSSDVLHYHVKKNASIDSLREMYRAMVFKFLTNTKAKIILIFDETYEPYYGYSKSPYIYGYKPLRGCTGCYKFLSCHALLPDGTKMFVDAVPMRKPSSMYNEVRMMINFVKISGAKILFCLFDRGYYDNKVINELERQRVKYLMLVPKSDGIKDVLAKNSEKIFVEKNYMVADKARTDIIVIREEHFVWTFATNLKFKELPNAIRTYKMRWNIETGFRVADEVRIMSKSTNIVVRYFFFLCTFVLYNVWKLRYSNKMSLRRFISTIGNLIIGEKYYWKGFMDCLLIFSQINQRSIL